MLYVVALSHHLQSDGHEDVHMKSGKKHEGGRELNPGYPMGLSGSGYSLSNLSSWRNLPALKF